MHGQTSANPTRKAKFRHMFSNNRAVNVLAAARIFLFASRDVWFVVGLPVYLRDRAGLELLAGRRLPGDLGDRLWHRPGRCPALHPAAETANTASPTGRTATWLAFVLAAFPAAIAIALTAGADPTVVIVVGLIAFGVVFAAQLGRPLVPDPRLRRRRQGRDERRLLLHGERRRPTRSARSSPGCSISGRASKPASGPPPPSFSWLRCSH